MKRTEAVKIYAGLLTAVVVFVIYAALMFRFTDEDMMELVVAYIAFMFAPSFAVPYMIGGENEDAD